VSIISVIINRVSAFQVLEQIQTILCTVTSHVQNYTALISYVVENYVYKYRSTAVHTQYVLG